MRVHNPLDLFSRVTTLGVSLAKYADPEGGQDRAAMLCPKALAIRTRENVRIMMTIQFHVLKKIAENVKDTVRNRSLFTITKKKKVSEKPVLISFRTRVRKLI